MKILKLLTAMAVCVLVFTPLSAMGKSEEFPAKPIELIVGFSPGGGTDIIARAFIGAVQKHLGQPMVVINKPGGGGQIGAHYVVKAKPDGYTLLFGFGGGEHVAAPHLRKLPYDPLVDLKPIMMVSVFPNGLVVRADSPWKTCDEFVEYAKKYPGKIKGSHAGVGSYSHLTGLALESAANIELTFVPFKGTRPALTALLGGHVDANACAPFMAWPHVQSGKLRILGYTLSERNEDLWPGIPTFKEQGYDVNLALGKGIGSPAATPDWIIKKLHDSFKKTMEDRSFKAMMGKMLLPITYMGPQEMKEWLKKQSKLNAKLIQERGIFLK